MALKMPYMIDEYFYMYYSNDLQDINNDDYNFDSCDFEICTLEK